MRSMTTLTGPVTKTILTSLSEMKPGPQHATATGARVDDFVQRCDLTDKVVLLSGASSGIGAHLAGVFARAGAHVYAIARRQDRLRELAAANPRIVAARCDVTIDEDCAAAVTGVIERYGRIDVLVNAAGVSRPARAEEESPASFRSVLEVNLVAPFVLSHYAAPHMLASEAGGVIINIASIVGLAGLGRIPQASYAASKAGLVNLTRELAAQWARKGIRVNAIAPGWFATEMTEDLFGAAESSAWVDRLTPMGRRGELPELDGAALFLAGGASTYMTGAVIAVDGGWTAV
jgi:NAD(P)-dependent dehydrogenase (short-subunit alcohol dehydrogenase family)